MSLTDESDNQLMRALNFNDDDLKANRRGLLTTAQRKRIRLWRFTWIMCVSVITLMLTVVGLHTHPSLEDDILGTLMIMIVPVVLWMIWFQRRVARALSQGKVMACRGTAIDTRGGMMISHKTFMSLGHTLVKGRMYTVYYVPLIDLPVSAEEYVKRRRASKAVSQPPEKAAVE